MAWGQRCRATLWACIWYRLYGNSILVALFLRKRGFVDIDVIVAVLLETVLDRVLYIF